MLDEQLLDETLRRFPWRLRQFRKGAQPSAKFLAMVVAEYRLLRREQKKRKPHAMG
jgi:hypothetical protein